MPLVFCSHEISGGLVLCLQAAMAQNPTGYQESAEANSQKAHATVIRLAMNATRSIRRAKENESAPPLPQILEGGPQGYPPG
jgi:hypothetical protein